MYWNLYRSSAGLFLSSLPLVYFCIGWKLLNAVYWHYWNCRQSVLKGRLKYNNLLNISIYGADTSMLVQLADEPLRIPYPRFGLILLAYFHTVPGFGDKKAA
jgi:hypothetical protein